MSRKILSRQAFSFKWYSGKLQNALQQVLFSLHLFPFSLTQNGSADIGSKKPYSCLVARKDHEKTPFPASAPVHPVCHVTGGRLLVPARRCPRAGERRIPPSSDAIRNGHSRRLSALADPDAGARPPRPRARTFPKGQRRPGARRRTKRRSLYAPAAPVRRASGGGPPPSPPLLAGPCRIPLCLLPR